MYEQMKPQDAARILDQLDVPVVLTMLSHMREMKAAPILAAMDPAKAKAVTLALAEQQKPPAIAEAATATDAPAKSTAVRPSMIALRNLIPPFALMVLLVARGAAADPVEIRAAPHDGFGRLAFAWPAPVHYTAHLAGETLTIRFARRLDGHADEVKHALAAYVADAEIEEQGKIFVAHLKRPVAFNAFTVERQDRRRRSHAPRRA